MHIHPPKSKKGLELREHFLHFIMLFLAVILGAIAENMREKYIENSREHEYLHFLVNDLCQDTLQLNKCIRARQEKLVGSTKLIGLLNKPKITETKDIYYLARLMTRVENFDGVDGALNLLQFSDGYRIIKNEKIINLINEYQYIRKSVYNLNKTEDEILIQYRNAASKVINAYVFSEMLNLEKNAKYKYFIKPLDENIPLFSYEKSNINNLIFWISSEKGNQSININQMKFLKLKGDELIKEINSEIQ